jgi:RNA polymerase sigma-70 factor (ECF subfamily)
MISGTQASATLLARIPELRAFAIMLCGNRDQGDDLVQDTLLSAWAHLDQFEEGTNMGAWLFTILRNRFRSLRRKQRGKGQIAQGVDPESVPTVPAQDGWAIATDLHYALGQLPPQQREALVLVGAAGMSLSEAASVCECPEGTIKSRVSRGRAQLAELLADEPGSAHARRHRRAIDDASSDVEPGEPAARDADEAEPHSACAGAVAAFPTHGPLAASPE